jgi:hypothetical protein
MMKLYYAPVEAVAENEHDLRNFVTAMGTVKLYLAEQADDRINQLERALKSCAAVISAELKERSKFQAVATDALNEADKALSL